MHGQAKQDSNELIFVEMPLFRLKNAIFCLSPIDFIILGDIK
jgi:hypothetical protein